MIPARSIDLQKAELTVGLSESGQPDLVAPRDATITVLDEVECEKVEVDEDAVLQTGWRSPPAHLSLPEAHATIKMPVNKQWWRQLLAYAGCGTIISVGYM